MTDLDKQLIDKADKLRRWDYRKIDTLMDQAQTQECRHLLYVIRCQLHDLVQETL